MSCGDHQAEADAIKAYNEAVALATSVADNATRELLEEILVDEDRHIDEIEERQDQIQQMGEQLFLSTQVS
ncbi:MAG: ferritin-like domain-containing protein [Planctomycetota bacterium]